MAKFKGSNPFKIPRPLAFPNGWNAETLAGTKTLTLGDSIFQALDPGGSGRNVVLPSGFTKGRFYFIANHADAAEDLTVQQPDASTTAATISQNEMAMLYAADDIADSATSGWAIFFISTGSIS